MVLGQYSSDSCGADSNSIKTFFIQLEDMGGVPREQKMLKGHLPRVIYHQVYKYTKIIWPLLEGAKPLSESRPRGSEAGS